MYITKTLPSYVIQLCVICHMLPDHVQNANVSNAVYLRFLNAFIYSLQSEKPFLGVS